MEEKIIEYAEFFNEPFPFFKLPIECRTIEEMMRIIDECLASGEPYDPAGDDDRDGVY